MNVAVVLVAAGAGTRLGASVPKAFVELGGRALVRHAVDHALACGQVGRVIVVAPPTELGRMRTLLSADDHDRLDVVAGGPTRAASVARGLMLLHPDDGIVLVHDAARALTPPSVFADVIAAVRGGHGAVVPGLPVPDTIKQVDEAGQVVATPPRADLRAVQTPQGFLRETLEHAHVTAGKAAESATDDAALVEAIGAPVTVIPGHPHAFKVTTEADLRTAEWLLATGQATS